MPDNDRRQRLTAWGVALWIVGLTTVGIVAELGQLPTPPSEWPGRVGALLGLGDAP